MSVVLPSFNNFTVTGVLKLSWLLLSDHSLVTVSDVFSGDVRVLVIDVPSITVVYPGTVFSWTVYTISVPFSFLFKSLKVYVQFPCASGITIALSTSVPFANNFTVILLGLIPSWLLLSLQVFVTVTLVGSGSWMLLIVAFVLTALYE